MDNWANLTLGLQFNDSHHQSCGEPSLQLSRHLFILHLFAGVVTTQKKMYQEDD